MEGLSPLIDGDSKQVIRGKVQVGRQHFCGREPALE